MRQSLKQSLEEFPIDWMWTERTEAPRFLVTVTRKMMGPLGRSDHFLLLKILSA